VEPESGQRRARYVLAKSMERARELNVGNTSPT